MTLDELIERLRKRRIPIPRITIYDIGNEEGGGWRVDIGPNVCKGNTLSIAILAAYHAATGKTDLWQGRLNPPDDAFPARRIRYDYRSPDWEPPRRRRVRL